MTENSRHANASHSSTQPCPLCIIWARMPYAKRWSTPTTANDTEGTLIVGFWLGIQYRTPEALCEKHSLLIQRINHNPLLLSHAEQLHQPQPTVGPRRVTNHVFQALSDPPTPNAICSSVEGSNVCDKGARYEASANFDTNGNVGTIKRLLCSDHAIALAEKESKPEPEVFKIGLVPFVNENTITEPPPLPVVIPMIPLQPNAQPNAGNGPQVQAAIESALRFPIPTNPTALQSPLVDPTELARQAALMPAEEGRRMESFTPVESDEPNEDTKH